MVTCRSHKPEDAGSNLAAATKDDLTQLVEYYPDTVEVDSSNLSVITELRFNSMEEVCYYKAEVVGSIPATATKMVRNSIGFRVPVFYTGSCEFESHRANKKRMNSSMAERVFVRHRVESSNLSSSSKLES